MSEIRARGQALAVAVALCTAPGAAAEPIESLADPTRPPMVSAAPAADVPVIADVQWRLAMVRVSGASRSAVLNGTLVREGDTLDGFRVERIAAGSVTLEGAGRRTVVAIADGSLKRPSGTSREPPARRSLKQSPAVPLRGNASTGEEAGIRVDASRSSAADPEAEATTRTGK